MARALAAMRLRLAAPAVPPKVIGALTVRLLTGLSVKDAPPVHVIGLATVMSPDPPVRDAVVCSVTLVPPFRLAMRVMAAAGRS
jgi:hypothetical protein